MTELEAMNSSEESSALFARATPLMPGGVNSPVRSFASVGGTPIFIARAEGPWLIDEDGNRFLDLYNSWGPAILGHAHPRVVEAVREQATRGLSFGAPTRLEVEMAEFIVRHVPAVEMVRMVNSGTEACMSALRLARAATGRDIVIKFEGCYHGHADSFLSKAGSGVATLGIPDSPGVPPNTAAATLNARYNDAESVEALFRAHPDRVAAVIIEPVAGNMGCVVPEPSFLESLRGICHKHGGLLIFDEVMTGFRLSLGGAHARFGIMPDIVCLGKIIGGGLPVAAYGGRRDLMQHVAPIGSMYQAGTLSGNPLGMAAGLATLRELEEYPEYYDELESRGMDLKDFIDDLASAKSLPICCNAIGSMLTLFFHPGPVLSWSDAKNCDKAAFAKFFHAMLRRGVHLPPAQFEAWFLSIALRDEHIAQLKSAIHSSLEGVFAAKD